MKSEIGVKFRTPYNYGPRNQKRNALDTGSESHVQQSAKSECDINFIMKKYQNTGVLPQLIKKEPQYGDFSDVSTYKESLELVMFSQEQFAALPAQVRKRFQNDPAEFLAWTSDASNLEEMASMGLLKPDAMERVQEQKEKAAEKAARQAAAKPKKGGDDPGASA